MNWLPAVIVLGSLLFLHELGHFLAARAAGVDVEEFSLGFGPRLIGIRRGGTLYALRLLPVLGYVRMAGMYPAEDDGTDAADVSRQANHGGRGFLSKGMGPRAAIIAAGPVMNFVISFVLLALVFGAVGLPSTPSLRIAQVEAGMPAASSGIAAGDRIVSVNGQSISTYVQLHQAITEDPPGQPLTLGVDRGGQTHTVTVTPQSGSNGPVIGVILVPMVTRLPWPQALWQGVVSTGQLLFQWVQGLWLLAHHSNQAQVLGPIGIGNVIDQASATGAGTLLLLAAWLSANLGLLNLLPLPALDGGRLTFILLEFIRGGRPIDPAKEGLVHFVGLAVMVALIIAISVHDIARLH